MQTNGSSPGQAQPNKFPEGELACTLTVEEVLNRWPQTVPVFIKYQTSCVGCSMSKFETLEDAAQIYNLKLAAFLYDLKQAAENKGT